MHFTKTTPVTLLLAALSGAASAFQPLLTDDTGTQGQGGKQFEISFVQAQANQWDSTTRTRSLPLVLTWGATDTLDLYVGTVANQILASPPGTDAGGWGNTALGAKWRWMEAPQTGTSLAVRPEVRLPVGSGPEAAGLGTGATSYGLALILTQELPFGAVHFNLAGARDLYADPDTRPHASTVRVSIAPVWQISEQWKLAGDLGHVAVTAGGESTTTQLLQLGAVYSPSTDIDLALGVMRSVDRAAIQTTTTTATLGLTWRWR
jgi:hypothetical protein